MKEPASMFIPGVELATMKDYGKAWSIPGLCCLAAVGGGLPAKADDTVQEQQLRVLETDALPEEYGIRAGSFIAAPVPFSNPTIGSGVALGAAWLFEVDPDSDSSSVGIGGFMSDNGSRAYGLSLDLNLLSDRYQLSFLAARAELTYAYTSGPFDFDIDQDGDLYRLDLLYGFDGMFSAGIGVRYLESSLAPNLGFGVALPDAVAEAAELEVLKYGAIFDQSVCCLGSSARQEAIPLRPHAIIRTKQKKAQ